jgi:hypothetical protein
VKTIKKHELIVPRGAVKLAVVVPAPKRAASRGGILQSRTFAAVSSS